MVTPSAFIVGVNKSGTTAVFNALSRQPNVCASTTKETHFFDPLKYGDALPALAEYEKFFEPRLSDDVVIEATPGYFYGGRVLAEKLREVSPEGKAAIILREPGARAFSWYRFARTRLLLPQNITFDEYLDRCEPLGLSPEQDKDQVGWRGLSGGAYAHWLPSWQSVFGEDLLVMYSDDFRARPEEALVRIGAHLGIDVVEAEDRQSNVSVDISNAKLQRVALALNRAGERIWRRHPRLKDRLLDVYYRLNSRKQQERMSDDARRRLDAHFAASLAELREMLPDVPETWGRAA
ncbi:sulfotransferase domain-containing protein [Microbacterium sp. G2-8]|uniref:sulfotransferase domain-containing protein n=1 Tax=Microbacterium sp. G2-8 TaxID=2842454 RepID=UPI001C8A8946|nr:sulfotransferase domain-containing protein [Microbacterium sp. G2-8]